MYILAFFHILGSIDVTSGGLSTHSMRDSLKAHSTPTMVVNKETEMGGSGMGGRNGRSCECQNKPTNQQVNQVLRWRVLMSTCSLRQGKRPSTLKWSNKLCEAAVVNAIG